MLFLVAESLLMEQQGWISPRGMSSSWEGSKAGVQGHGDAFCPTGLRGWGAWVLTEGP